MPLATTRRRFLQDAGQAALIPGLIASGLPTPRTLKPRLKIERRAIGAIGLRYQGSVIARQAQSHGDLVAICDVDRHVREQARASFGSTPLIFEDYRKLLDRDDVDVVVIGTPDHWHAKMVIDACRAGKDVYVEKPLTLTVDEGKKIIDAVRQTQRIVQVGSWQRSDQRFRLAVEVVRAGRIGTLRQVDVVLAKNPTGGPFAVRPVPGHLNWELWQGQTPAVPYVEERCHYTFRWWREYSGGVMTDWGAHHIDIAKWAVDSEVDTVQGVAKFPTAAGGYNVPVDFQVNYRFQNGVRMTVQDTGRNGIMFTGTAGRIFVNRGVLSGTPVEQLVDRPLPREEFRLYADDNLDRPERSGKLEAIVNHMGNFMDCVDSRKTPLSDVSSQHRSTLTCHIANISMEVGRELQWDNERQKFFDDDEANGLLAREQRPGFEVV